MAKMVGFIKLYFPVFLLGAIFGKVVEITGIAEKIAKIIIHFIGVKRAILSIVLMGAILTYSGVSLFVAVFAIYPFAAQLFREADIPKRLFQRQLHSVHSRFRWIHFLDHLKSKMLFQLRSLKQIFMQLLH